MKTNGSEDIETQLYNEIKSQRSPAEAHRGGASKGIAPPPQASSFLSKNKNFTPNFLFYFFNFAPPFFFLLKKFDPPKFQMLALPLAGGIIVTIVPKEDHLECSYGRDAQ
jgi:hypothetical protein